MFEYNAPEHLLKDKIILITGAGSGIGKTAALTFARHGATTILLGRTTSKLEAVYDEIEANGWPQAAIYPMNLEGASEQDYANLADTLEKRVWPTGRPTPQCRLTGRAQNNCSV